MIKLARKIIRKNKFLYNFVCYVFKHTIYRNLFTDIYKSKEITIFEKKFYYPKHSESYEKFFSNFKNYTYNMQHYYKTLTNKFNFDNIDCIIDIGSNVGYLAAFYNFFFQKKIICFEPSSINFYYLKKNLSEYKNIELNNFALGSEDKNSFLSIPSFEQNRPGDLGLLTLKENFQSKMFREKISVKNFSDLKYFNQDGKNYYIKIDVEGYELEVLNGMESFVEKNNCIFKIELNKNYYDKNTFLKIKKYFMQKKYSPFIFDREFKELRKKSFEDLAVMLETDIYDITFVKEHHLR